MRPSLVEAIGIGVGQGQHGGEDRESGFSLTTCSMSGTRVAQGAPHQLHHDQLRPEGGDHVGLPAIRAQLQGLLGQLLAAIRVAVHQGPRGALHGVHPVQEGQIELLDQPALISSSGPSRRCRPPIRP